MREHQEGISTPTFPSSHPKLSAVVGSTVISPKPTLLVVFWAIVSFCGVLEYLLSKRTLCKIRSERMTKW
jgi:hypothetical protein